MSSVEMPRSIVDRARYRLRHHLVIQALLIMLGSVGIEIAPYYITHESLNPEAKPQVDPGLGPLTVCLLSPAEIEAVYTHPDSKEMGDMKVYLDERCLCFGLRLKEEIAACMWCNLHRCHHRFNTFTVKDDEAYLCGMVTFRSYRGRNLAPLLRYEVYRYLNGNGRTKFYSITEFFNHSALKFKEKLGSKPLRLNIYIGLFKRYRWNITLKRFPI
jgi:hypothetical protein